MKVNFDGLVSNQSGLDCVACWGTLLWLFNLIIRSGHLAILYVFMLTPRAVCLMCGDPIVVWCAHVQGLRPGVCSQGSTCVVCRDAGIVWA